MIRNRLAYLFLLLLGVVFVMAFGGRLPVFLLFCLLLIPLFSIFATLISSKRLELSQTIQKYILQKGEQTNYTLKLSNRGPLFCPLVRAIFLEEGRQVTPQWKKQHIFSLPGHSCESYTYKLTGSYRGKYSVGVAHLEVLDYLGLFRLKRRANQKLIFKVFPQTVPLSDFHADLGQQVHHQELSLFSQEDRTSISDLKSYQPGDHMKNIHWKLSAKRCDLLVKNFEIISNAGATIAIDCQPFFYKPEDALALEDRMIASAVALEQYLNKKAIPVSLAYAAAELQLLGKGYSFDELLDVTAFLPFKSGLSASGLLQAVSARSLISTSVLLFTHNLDETLCSEILRLGINGIRCTLLYFSFAGDPRKTDKLALVYRLMERGIDCYPISESGDLKTQIERNK